MRIVTIVAAVVTAVPAATVVAAQIPEEAINAAIERGIRSKKPEYADGGSGTFMAQGRGYDVVVMGPLNRIANAAAAHAKKYLPFTRDSVTPAMVEPVVSIEAHPRTAEFMGGKRKEDVAAVLPGSRSVTLRSGRQQAYKPTPTLHRAAPARSARLSR